MGPENTYNRGSLQVDNIYVLPLLRQFEFEVLLTTEGVCGADHKALIFQIPRKALGIGQLPQQKYKRQQLKMQDPKIQNRYFKEYKSQCSQQDFQMNERTLGSNHTGEGTEPNATGGI